MSRQDVNRILKIKDKLNKNKRNFVSQSNSNLLNIKIYLDSRNLQGLAGREFLDFRTNPNRKFNDRVRNGNKRDKVFSACGSRNLERIGMIHNFEFMI